MNILRHLLLLSSAGFASGWTMVQTGLATELYIAAGLLTAFLMLLYLLLAMLVWLTRHFSYDAEHASDYYPKSKLFGFDERGDLRIESDYPIRD